MKQCPECGIEIPDDLHGLKSCPNCGFPIEANRDNVDCNDMTVDELFSKGMKLVEAHKIVEALPYIQKAGELGDGASLLMLAVIYYKPCSNGLPLEKLDREKAKSYMIQSFRAKEFGALNALIELCRDGVENVPDCLNDIFARIENSDDIDVEQCALSIALIGFVYLPEASDEEKDAVEMSKESKSKIDSYCNDFMTLAIDALMKSASSLPPDNEIRKKLDHLIMLKFQERAASQIVYPKMIEMGTKEEFVYFFAYSHYRLGRITGQDIPASIHVIYKSWEALGWCDSLRNSYILSIHDIDAHNEEGIKFLRYLTNCNDDEVRNKAKQKYNLFMQSKTGRNVSYSHSSSKESFRLNYLPYCGCFC